jgi:hypothetical protein
MSAKLKARERDERPAERRTVGAHQISVQPQQGDGAGHHDSEQRPSAIARLRDEIVVRGHRQLVWEFEQVRAGGHQRKH